MLTNKYTYCLLQYRHSQLLEEVLNIGLLIYFPDERKINFIYPEKLLRLKFAYPDVPDHTIKAYYKSFEKKVNELNSRPDIFSDFLIGESFEKFVESEFLPKDSSTLQFGPLKKGISYHESSQTVLDQLYNTYFIVFEKNEHYSTRLDEIHLLRKYKRLLFEYDSELVRNSKKIQFDYTIVAEGDKQFKFDVAWQKQSQLNLVKPVSFDLKKVEALQNKAYRFYGQFLDLEDLASRNHYSFDLIIGKPKERSLFKPYDNALKLLQKPKHVRLVEESELNKYSENTAKALIS